MAPVLKTGMGKLIVGSNPTPSAPRPAGVPSEALFGGQQDPRTGAGGGEPVVRVDELAPLQRQASAADAAGELVAQPFHQGDAIIQPPAPVRGQPGPIGPGRCAV